MTMALPGNGFLPVPSDTYSSEETTLISADINTNVSTTAPGPNSGDNTVPNVPITTVNPITPISNNTEHDEDEGDGDEDEEEEEDEDY